MSHGRCIWIGGGSGSWSEVVVHVRDGLPMFFELLFDFVEADAGVVDAVEEEGSAGARIFAVLCGVLLELVLPFYEEH